jgi:hypothetical protein
MRKALADAQAIMNFVRPFYPPKREIRSELSTRKKTAGFPAVLHKLFKI